MEKTNQEFTREEVQAIKKMQGLFRLMSEIDFLEHCYFDSNLTKKICLTPDPKTENYNFTNFVTQSFARIIGMIERGELVLSEEYKNKIK